jgi:hypothetical protein
MSLVVRRNNSFDDSADRQAWRRYCESRDYLLKYDSQTAEIDGFMLTPKGYAAVELACNACWTTQSEYPTHEDVHIPSRKLKYFCRVLEGCELPDEDGNWSKVGTGYLVLFNIGRTRAAFVEFAVVLERRSEPFTKELNGELCEVVTIPHDTLRYVDIPRVNGTKTTKEE